MTIKPRKDFGIIAITTFIVGCSSSNPGPGSGGPSGAAGNAGHSESASGAPGGSLGTAGAAQTAGGASGTTAQDAAAGQSNVSAGSGGSGDSGGTTSAGGGGGSAPDLGGLYVSPSGSDDNSGTIAAPFLTLGKARDVVRTLNTNMTDDIHVYLRGGSYRVAATIAFAPQDSGSNGHRIHYQAYPGETPILNGAVQVSGFTPASGGVYKASLSRSTKLRNLYVNDARAALTSKTVTARGGTGTYTVTAGQASWAWASGSQADGVKYNLSDVPAISSNKDDLEIVNATTWNENIVCVRDVVTTSDNYRGLLLQEPYGAIAQLPEWGAGFSTTGTHTLFNAFEFLNGPGQFYFDKTAGVLYYYPRPGENMATADVEVPVVERLLDIAGTSTSNRVRNLAFEGLTFENTDYALYQVAGSHGKATVQGATVYIAYGDGNWHNSKYEITDTLPGVINASNADSLEFSGNVVKHSGSEGISLINDVINTTVIGNYITDVTGSGITIGHPQHVYLGDGGAHEKYAPGVEGICTQDTVSNNLLLNVSSQRGFGGHAGVTAFFVDTLAISHNHIESTAYNGINLGWGWSNFPDSTTCKNNSVNSNRLVNNLTRLHDSGAIYTIGQMPGTTINQNYVKGIPAAIGGPTYGLHNDEGSAYITENDNVLDINPGVTYTINCEDYGKKHDLTIRRTYATVNKMGVNPPNSVIDPPVAVPDNVWPLAQYDACVASGLEDASRSVAPSSLMAPADWVFPASCAAAVGATEPITVRSAGSTGAAIWFAPSGTVQFTAGTTMTTASGDATSLAVPKTAGTYKLFVLDAQGNKLGESAALLRVK